jgi:hypothetical protein
MVQLRGEYIHMTAYIKNYAIFRVSLLSTCVSATIPRRQFLSEQSLFEKFISNTKKKIPVGNQVLLENYLYSLIGSEIIR